MWLKELALLIIIILVILLIIMANNQCLSVFIYITIYTITLLLLYYLIHIYIYLNILVASHVFYYILNWENLGFGCLNFPQPNPLLLLSQCSRYEKNSAITIVGASTAVAPLPFQKLKISRNFIFACKHLQDLNFFLKLIFALKAKLLDFIPNKNCIFFVNFDALCVFCLSISLTNFFQIHSTTATA